MTRIISAIRMTDREYLQRIAHVLNTCQVRWDGDTVLDYIGALVTAAVAHPVAPTGEYVNSTSTAGVSGGTEYVLVPPRWIVLGAGKDPENGSTVLYWNARVGRPYIGDNWSYDEYHAYASHWMPLPPSPISGPTIK